jgi:predicted Zn-dependent peptidase
MLSRSLRTAIPRAARSYATSVSESAGVKVAGIDAGQPTTSVSVVIKAGSRYETLPGVAHALKNFAFKVSEEGSGISWDKGRDRMDLICCLKACKKELEQKTSIVHQRAGTPSDLIHNQVMRTYPSYSSPIILLRYPSSIITHSP